MEAPPRPRGSLNWQAQRARVVPRPPDPAEAANPPTPQETEAALEIEAAAAELIAAQSDAHRLEAKISDAGGDDLLLADYSSRRVGRDEGLLRQADDLRGIAIRRLDEARDRHRTALVAYNQLMQDRSRRLEEWRRAEREQARFLAEKAARKKKNALRSLLERVLG
jgi:hypothetical protein